MTHLACTRAALCAAVALSAPAARFPVSGADVY